MKDFMGNADRGQGIFGFAGHVWATILHLVHTWGTWQISGLHWVAAHFIFVSQLDASWDHWPITVITIVIIMHKWEGWTAIFGFINEFPEIDDFMTIN